MSKTLIRFICLTKQIFDKTSRKDYRPSAATPPSTLGRSMMPKTKPNNSVQEEEDEEEEEEQSCSSITLGVILFVFRRIHKQPRVYKVRTNNSEPYYSTARLLLKTTNRTVYSGSRVVHLFIDFLVHIDENCNHFFACVIVLACAVFSFFNRGDFCV